MIKIIGARERARALYCPALKIRVSGTHLKARPGPGCFFNPKTDKWRQKDGWGLVNASLAETLRSLDSARVYFKGTQQGVMEGDA